VIVGCDGLWKSFSNEEGIKFVNSTVENEKAIENTTETKKKNIYEICCSRMATEAVKKLAADNVTVVLFNTIFDAFFIINLCFYFDI
jgi:integrin-linked kinase-associated serine/threonine phosphatase 2C